jgi:hypothetical protein
MGTSSQGLLWLVEQSGRGIRPRSEVIVKVLSGKDLSNYFVKILSD